MVTVTVRSLMVVTSLELAPLPSVPTRRIEDSTHRRLFRSGAGWTSRTLQDVSGGKPPRQGSRPAGEPALGGEPEVNGSATAGHACSRCPAVAINGSQEPV